MPADPLVLSTHVGVHVDFTHAGPAAAVADTGEGSQWVQETSQSQHSEDAAAAGVLLPAWPQLAETAGLWLRDSYGWCGFGEAAGAPAAAAAAAAEAARHAAASLSSDSTAATVARPSTVDSLYDCFMMLLLQQMLAGPAALNAHHTSSSSGIDLSRSTVSKSSRVPDNLSQRSQGLDAAAASAATAVDPAGLSDEEWESWLEGDAFTALAGDVYYSSVVYYSMLHLNSC